MSKKYELLQITDLLSEDVKIQVLSMYVAKLTMELDMSKYYETCEMTLFLYNCVINADLPVTDDNEFDYVLNLYNTIYKNNLMTEDTKNKIKVDLQYIKQKKLFTKISNIYYYTHLAYTFFFCPNIYVIEQ